MQTKRYLAIDPSGSGTTGIFFYDTESKSEEFANFRSKYWRDHFVFIKDFCEERRVDCIVYETTNFIKVRGYDLTSLFKIFGMIESLPYILPVKKCETILVREVKILGKKLKEKLVMIDNLSWKAGRGGGWFHKQRKLETHELDAFLVFHCYLGKLAEPQLLTIE